MSLLTREPWTFSSVSTGSRNTNSTANGYGQYLNQTDQESLTAYILDPRPSSTSLGDSGDLVVSFLDPAPSTFSYVLQHNQQAKVPAPSAVFQTVPATRAAPPPDIECRSLSNVSIGSKMSCRVCTGSRNFNNISEGFTNSCSVSASFRNKFRTFIRVSAGSNNSCSPETLAEDLN